MLTKFLTSAADVRSHSSRFDAGITIEGKKPIRKGQFT